MANIKDRSYIYAEFGWFVQTLGILLTFIEVGVGGGGVTGLREISSSGATSGFSENILSRSICSKRINTFN